MKQFKAVNKDKLHELLFDFSDIADMETTRWQSSRVICIDDPDNKESRNKIMLLESHYVIYYRHKGDWFVFEVEE